MKTWVISDTHLKHGELKIPRKIDCVICSGDWADSKAPAINYEESLKFLNWFNSLHADYKILIAGNHNTAMQTQPYESLLKEKLDKYGIYYLEDSSVSIEGLNIYGSPWTLEFGRDWAFNISKNHSGQIYDIIPEDTNILITHGPPYGILDLTKSGNLIGDCTLRKRVFNLSKLKYHIFGHLHECGGTIKNISGVTFINAAAVNLNHTLTNNGIILEL